MGLKPGFGRLATLREAIDVLMERSLILEPETVTLHEALNRVLARDLTAPIDVPHFAKAAMDGYAVVAADTFGASDSSPKQLMISGVLSPGRAGEMAVSGGACLEISTGAPMPDGADAVVMVEYTEPAGEGQVRIRKGVGPGDNVIRAASDIQKGAIVLEAGTVLRAPQIGVVAALGLDRVDVVSRPRVAVYSIGSELLQPGEELRPGRIYDINFHTLSAALTDDGFEVLQEQTVPDDLGALESAVARGLDEADLVLVSGGSSLGRSDLVVEAFEKAGRVLIHGVAVKPGKPLVIAVAGGRARDGKTRIEKLMIGLPGYPMSALSDLYVFVQPWLRKVMGVREVPRFTHAVLARKHASVLGRYEFLPVALRDGLAHPLSKGSSSISALASADGFVEVHENTEVLEEGSPVSVRLF